MMFATKRIKHIMHFYDFSLKELFKKKFIERTSNVSYPLMNKRSTFLVKAFTKAKFE